MTPFYPTSFASVRAWAAENRLTIAEARERFVQFAILRGIASSPMLRDMLVFKGGNALDFIWQPNRSTHDLDFSADMSVIDPMLGTVALGELLKTLLADALTESAAGLDLSLVVHRVKQQPPGALRRFVTYRVTIGYALPDEPDLRNRLQQGEELRRSMPVEVSLNEPICADRRVDLDHAHILRISTVEDIVAEKLRALLQQTIRNRTRRQDLLDIAVILTKQPQLDRERVADYLLRKAAARDVPVSRTAFRSPELAERAGQGYAELQPTTRTLFIPFDEALAILHRFVDELAIPE